jgi:hypothetical protein
MPRALVIGDGPAGLLAAITLRRAGWSVQIAAGRPGARPHHRHVHQIAPSVLTAIERLAGSKLTGWRVADHLWIDSASPARALSAPMVDPAALVAALGWRAANVGVTETTPRTNLAAEAWRFDLLVDASGSGVLASRTPTLDVAIDESDVIDECWSWRGRAESSGAPWSIAVRDEALALLLTRDESGTCILTARAMDAPAPLLDPARLLDRMMVAVGHRWALRMGDLHLVPGPLRHRAPFARRIRVTRRADGPPLLRIGDGLIQTAPRFGQGFAQIVEQIDAMAPAIAGTRSLQEGIESVEASADRRWLTTMMGTAISQTIAA